MCNNLKDDLVGNIETYYKTQTGTIASGNKVVKFLQNEWFQKPENKRKVSLFIYEIVPDT